MRLFVAIDLPGDVRRDLDRRTEPLRAELPAARWVRPEAMHLTLAFLGETAPELLSDLHRELAPAFAAHPKMRLRVTGAGGFPPRGRCRVVWAGLEADGDLAQLQAAVATAAGRALGIEPEKQAFRPHATLARCRPPWPRQALSALERAFAPPLREPFEVTAGTLFESRLRPSGAEYHAHREYPLGARAEERP